MRISVALAIILGALGISLVIAEEISIQAYLNTPCDSPCDKVVSRSQVPFGILPIIGCGIVFLIRRVIGHQPPQTTVDE